MKVRKRLQIIRDWIYRRLSNKDVVEVNGIYLCLRDREISDRMFYVLTHGYEVEEISLADRWISKEDRIVEAGSAIGFIGLYCITKLSCRNYAMIEANPGLTNVMRRNFELNSVDFNSADIINAAVAAEDGVISFGLSENFWSSSTRDRDSTIRRLTVPAVSLPKVVENLSWKPTTLIMDIEGGEIDIPVNHYDLFSKIIIETHSRVVGEERINNLISSLEDIGFRVVDKLDTNYVLTK